MIPLDELTTAESPSSGAAVFVSHSPSYDTESPQATVAASGNL